MMLDRIVGLSTDREISRKLLLLDHEGRLEFVILDRKEMEHRMLDVRTDRGTHCAIALPRTQRLVDGAVLLLTDDRAIVVRTEPERWLVFQAETAAGGLELGYCVGRMHRLVRFQGDHLYVVGAPGSKGILDRVDHMIAQGTVTFLGDRA